MLEWFRVRHQRCDRVRKDAADLLLFMGDRAYEEARNRSREARDRSDRAASRYWSHVAAEIASSIGHNVGVATTDKFLADRPPPPDPSRKATIADLANVAEAIRDLSLGKADATTLHNAEAAVYRIAARLQISGAEAVGGELRSALRALAKAPEVSAAAIAVGAYPPLADAAGKALQRLKAVALD